MSKDKEIKKEAELLIKLKETLENDITIRKLDLTIDELKIIKPYNLLTLKPIIYMANVSEDDLALGTNNYVEKVKEYVNKEGAKVIVVCAKVEEELSELNDTDKKRF